MPVCPLGHTSESADYCDVCGNPMEGTPHADLAAAPSTAEPGAPAPGGAEAAASGAEDVCPMCGTPRSGRFCEVDAYDFETGRVHTVQLPSEVYFAPTPPTPPQPPPDVQQGVTAQGSGRTHGAEAAVPGGWTVHIGADRAYYDTVIAQGGPDASALAFPPYCPERQIVLYGDKIRIGRRSNARAILPEIDLSTPPEDPGVSHLHAVLVAQPDGTWALIDPGSTNGTTVNGATEPIALNVPVPLGDGDRVHVGAWTTITLISQGKTPP